MRKLFVVLSVLLCSVSSLRASVSSGETALQIEDGTYYLYCKAYDAFLSRGASWGTQATLDLYGVPIEITDIDGYMLRYVDDAYNRYLGTDIGLPYVDKNVGDPIYWSFEPGTNGGILLYCKESIEGNSFEGGYLTAYVDPREEMNEGCSFTDDSTEALEFEFVDLDEYNRIIDSRYSCKQEIGGCMPIDMTSVMKNPRMSDGLDGWDNDIECYSVGSITTRSNLTEAYQSTGGISQIITGLKPGIYKFSLQGFYRGSTALICSGYDNLGYILSNAYIYANDAQERFAPWARHRKGTLYPNSMEEAYTLISDGKYVTDVYTRVGTDGVLKIGLALHQWVSASWLIWGNATLTYYEPAVEQDPDPSDNLGLHTLVVKFKNGRSISFCLSEKPEISFVSDKFSIMSDNVMLTSYNRKDIEEFYFEEITTEIEEVEQDEIAFRYTDNDHVMINGLSGDEVVFVYDMSGKLMYTEIASSDECLTISLSQFGRGTYIIKIDNKQSFKIIRK